VTKKKKRRQDSERETELQVSLQKKNLYFYSLGENLFSAIVGFLCIRTLGS
jgi:hypothetical protein